MAYPEEEIGRQTKFNFICNYCHEKKYVSEYEIIEMDWVEIHVSYRFSAMAFLCPQCQKKLNLSPILTQLEILFPKNR